MIFIKCKKLELLLKMVARGFEAFVVYMLGVE